MSQIAEKTEKTACQTSCQTVGDEYADSPILRSLLQEFLRELREASSVGLYGHVSVTAYMQGGVINGVNLDRHKKIK